jgi:hypothetical protein
MINSMPKFLFGEQLWHRSSQNIDIIQQIDLIDAYDRTTEFSATYSGAEPTI